jgi:hypothetical protein
MEKPPGHIAESNKFLLAVPWHRTWPAWILLALAGILFWSGSLHFHHQQTPRQEASTHNLAITRNGARERTNHGTPTGATHEIARPAAFELALPQEIERYLDALEDAEAEDLYPVARDHIGSSEVKTLALRYHLSDSGQRTDRIITLLSDLNTADSLSAAKLLVLHPDHEADTPILLACATSLAKNGGQDSIQAILERLNLAPPDDSGNAPENTIPLIHSLALARAPELEWFIGQAAEGKWIATTTASRMAAVNALRSYPSIHTTSILARLRDNDDSPHIRQLATEVLARIQAQYSE